MLYQQKAPEGLIYRKEGDTFTPEGSGEALQVLKGEVRFIYVTEGKPEYTLYLTLADSTLIGIALSDADTDAYEVISALGKAAEAGIDFLRPVSIAAYPEGYEVTAYDVDTPRILPAAPMPSEAIRRASVRYYTEAVNKAVPPTF